MADRTPGARPPADLPGVLTTIARRLQSLERRLDALEQQAGQSLPPDFRFRTGPEGELMIERVSTGATLTLDV